MRWFITLPFLRYNGMAMYPFIFIRKADYKKDAVLVNHECIHHRQQLELLIIPFYVFYLLHYVINLFLFRNHDKAYRGIIFEKEAYANEKNSGYLSQRKRWNFITYL